MVPHTLKNLRGPLGKLTEYPMEECWHAYNESKVDNVVFSNVLRQKGIPQENLAVVCFLKSKWLLCDARITLRGNFPSNFSVNLDYREKLPEP